MKRFAPQLMVIMLFLAVSAGLVKADDVIINKESTVKNGVIYLKDIATINAPSAISRVLGQVKIGSSPQPGKEKRIPEGLIRTRIFAALPSAELSIVMPTDVVVKRAYQILSEISLKKLYTEHIEKRLNGKKFKITKLTVRGNRKFPVGKLSIEIKEKRDKQISGHYRLVLNVATEGEKKRRIMLSGWVDRYETVVYAGKLISKGELITPDLLYTELTNITKSPEDIFSDPSSLMGMTAKKTIRKDLIVRQKMLTVSPVIRKGDMVKITARSGALKVVTLGLAVEDAKIGEQVKVRNIKSNKIVTGLVKDSKMVEIVF